MEIIAYVKYKVKIKGKASVLVSRTFDEFEEHTWDGEKIMSGVALLDMIAKNLKDNYMCSMKVIDAKTIIFDYFNYNNGSDSTETYIFTPIIEQ